LEADAGFRLDNGSCGVWRTRIDDCVRSAVSGPQG
jgi:hypothetical protein